MVEGWKKYTIGDLLLFKNGLNKEKSAFGKGTPIINYTDVYNNKAIKKEIIKGKVTLSRNEMRNFEIKIGDVLFTRTSETLEEVGLASVVLEEIENCTFSGFLLRGRNKTNLLDNNYSKYCFRAKNIRQAIIQNASYTIRALTNGNILSKIDIYIPLIKEQKAIADKLSNIDNLINSLQNLIDKKEKIKESIMVNYLTGKKTLKGFHGIIKTYKMKDMLEVIVDNRGKTPPTEGNGIPVIEVKALTNTMIDYGKIEKYVSKETYNSWFRNSLKPNDILFSTVGTTALSSLYTGEIKSCIAQNIVGLRFKNVSKKYMAYLFNLKSIIDYIRKIEMGAVQPSIKVSQMVELEIPIHQDINEQKAIADILGNMDNEISNLKEKLEKYKKIKEEMTDLLLTGKVRLINE